MNDLDTGRETPELSMEPDDAGAEDAPAAPFEGGDDADTGASPESAETEGSGAALGPPETPEGYSFGPGESASGYDTGLADWFRESAHATELPDNVAKALHDRFRERVHRQSGEFWGEMGQAQATARATLRQEWGAEFESRLADARSVIDRLGGGALKDALNHTGSGDDPAVIRVFAAIGRALHAADGPGSARTGSQTNAVGAADDATEARRAIMRLRADAGFMAAYGSRAHPDHKTAQDQMDQLYAIAYPGPAV
jgi:hypothetical protein